MTQFLLNLRALPFRPTESLSPVRARVSRVAPWLALLFLCGTLFFNRLADCDLWNSHEGRAAMDGQAVLQDGNWALPQLFGGQLELQKPPLFYWLVALIAWVRGGPVDAWAVRLPSAVAATAGVLLLHGLGLRRGRPVAGFVAAVVLATAWHYTKIARVGRIDIPLALTTAVAILALQRVEQAEGWFRLAIGYVAIAAGVLFKGPIGAVLPAAVLIAHSALAGALPAPWRIRPWLILPRRLGLWWGIPLVLGLTLPWFWWANQETHGELFQVFIWHHNVERGLGGSDSLKAHPWWYYGPLLAYDFLPWSPALLLAGFSAWRGRWWRLDREGRLGAVWLVATLAVLSCAQFKRDDYLLPAYPGAALVLGCAAERWLRGSRHPALLLALFVALVAGCTGGWWFYTTYRLPREEPTRDYRPFAEEIRRQAPAPRTVHFFRTESHTLAFHVGRPLDVFVEWGELDALAGRPEASYVVMPPGSAEEWPRYLKAGKLEEVGRTDQGPCPHEKPLVLLRTRPARP